MSAPGSHSTPPARARLAFGPFVLDPLRAELRHADVVVPLRRKAFDLLLALASRPGEVLGKNELMATVWPGVVVGEDSLAQCVHELRAALGADGAALVHTVPRRGYRFDAPVLAQPSLTDDGDVTGAGAAPAPMAKRPPRWRTLAQRFDRWQTQPPATAAPPLSLVLLPLQVDDPDTTPVWFADALTADLTAELGRLPHSRTALQLSPNLPLSAAFLAGALQAQGRGVAAREVLTELARRRPDIRLATIAAMLASRQPDYLAARERLLAQLRALGMI